MQSSLHIPTQMNDDRNNPPCHKEINVQQFTYPQYVTHIKLKEAVIITYKTHNHL